MTVEIDKGSGFCFGVVWAIETAEKELKKHNTLYCLGDIVHNSEEVTRLNKLGLKVIEHKDFERVRGFKVLIRAHGEPPKTYQEAQNYGICLVDATCPIVLKLQEKVKQGYAQMQACGGQVVIFGKRGHAEVIGLAGQTNNTAVIISSFEDAQAIEFNKSIRLFAQTTMNAEDYIKIKAYIKERCEENKLSFQAADSICAQMSKRSGQLANFAKKHEVILFVGGEKSSNGKYLFSICRQYNSRTYFIGNVTELKDEYLCREDGSRVNNVGICGATSTPMWLMENIAELCI